MINMQSNSRQHSTVVLAGVCRQWAITRVALGRFAFHIDMRRAADSGHIEYVSAPLLHSRVSIPDRRARACQHILAAYTSEQPVYIRRNRAARVVRKVVSKLSKLEWLSLLLLVCLSVFERPVWCIEGQNGDDGSYSCEGSDYPVWGHAFLQLDQAFTWEFSLLAVQLVFLAGHVFAGAQLIRAGTPASTGAPAASHSKCSSLAFGLRFAMCSPFLRLAPIAALHLHMPPPNKRRPVLARANAAVTNPDTPAQSLHCRAGGWPYFQPYYNKVHAALLAAAVLDAVIAYATPPTVPRVGAFLRIWLLAIRSSDTRRELWMIARIIPGLSSVLILTVMTLAFFAFFGLVLFHDTEPHFFGTFWRAMWQLWVLMTTSNFPDVRPANLFSGLLCNHDVCTSALLCIAAVRQSTCAQSPILGDQKGHNILAECCVLCAGHAQGIQQRARIGHLLHCVHRHGNLLPDELLHGGCVHAVPAGAHITVCVMMVCVNVCVYMLTWPSGHLYAAPAGALMAVWASACMHVLTWPNGGQHQYQYAYLAALYACLAHQHVHL
jgi:Ion transport protein